jgi:nucleoid DNA-binding protein
VLARNKLKYEVYKEIQDEIGSSIAEIEGVVDSQFSFIAKIIARGLFESVRLPYFGRFSVNPYRLRRLNIEKGKKPVNESV